MNSDFNSETIMENYINGFSPQPPASSSTGISLSPPAAYLRQHQQNGSSPPAKVDITQTLRNSSITSQKASVITEISNKSPPSKNLSHVPCKFFRQGACQAGISCPFSHATDISNETQPCKYFQKGNCKFGVKCALAHILPDGRRVNPKSLQQVYNQQQNQNGGNQQQQHQQQNGNNYSLSRGRGSFSVAYQPSSALSSSFNSSEPININYQQQQQQNQQQQVSSQQQQPQMYGSINQNRQAPPPLPILSQSQQTYSSNFEASPYSSSNTPISTPTHSRMLLSSGAPTNIATSPFNSTHSIWSSSMTENTSSGAASVPSQYDIMMSSNNHYSAGGNLSSSMSNGNGTSRFLRTMSASQQQLNPRHFSFSSNSYANSSNNATNSPSTPSYQLSASMNQSNSTPSSTSALTTNFQDLMMNHSNSINSDSALVDSEDDSNDESRSNPSPSTRDISLLVMPTTANSNSSAPVSSYTQQHQALTTSIKHQIGEDAIDGSNDDVDFVPSSLSDLLTPQELQRRTSRPSFGNARPSFSNSASTAAVVDDDTQFIME